MIKMFALNSIARAGLAGLAVVWAVEPAPAREYQYCLHEFSSAMRDCAFETMEQCVAMISGRGGSCVRDPYVAEIRASHVDSEKTRDRPRRHGRD